MQHLKIATLSEARQSTPNGFGVMSGKTCDSVTRENPFPVELDQTMTKRIKELGEPNQTSTMICWTTDALKAREFEQQ